MFSKYRYIYTLYHEQSFTKAAEKLFISQPSLSAAVKGIEQGIGAPLFERTGTGLVPTEIGRAYLDAVETIIQAENAFCRKMDDIHGLKSGTLTVGGTNYLCSYVLPKIINRFTSLYPGIKVNVEEAHSEVLAQMLKNEELDIVIDSFSENIDQFEGVPLINEQVLLCVPSDREINKKLCKYTIHPEDIFRGADSFYSAAPVSILEFKDEDFIMLKKGNDMRLRADSIFENGGITPKIKFSVDQMNIAYAMAESGNGLCFATDTLFRYGKFFRDIALYRIKESCDTRTLYAAYKKKRYCTDAMHRFILLAQDIIQ